MNPSTFLRQLRYWSFHCSFNALPSFCIAMIYLQLWQSPDAIAAMLCAIGTFILLYTTLTSLNGPLADKNHTLSRALHLGVRIRAVISGCSLAAAFTPLLFLSPDLWCGVLAIYLRDFTIKTLGSRWSFLGPRALHGGIIDRDFFSIFATTLLEGILLSLLLLIVSFFAVMLIQANERRKMHPFPVDDTRLHN